MQKAKFFLGVPVLLSASGRMSRLQYFFYGSIYAVIFFTLFMSLAMSGVIHLDENGDLSDLSVMSVTSYVLTFSIFCYCLFCQCAKRLHDIGWPAAFALLILLDVPVDLGVMIAHAYGPVPVEVDLVRKGVDGVVKVISWGMGLVLTFYPGHHGKNKYGPDPLKPPAPPIEVF